MRVTCVSPDWPGESVHERPCAQRWWLRWVQACEGCWHGSLQVACGREDGPSLSSSVLARWSPASVSSVTGRGLGSGALVPCSGFDGDPGSGCCDLLEGLLPPFQREEGSWKTSRCPSSIASVLCSRRCSPRVTAYGLEPGEPRRPRVPFEGTANWSGGTASSLTLRHYHNHPRRRSGLGSL